MGGWRRYLELQAQAKTGLSSGLFVWALLAVVFGVVTFGFTLVTAFIWLADRYEPLIAALALVGFFLLVTIIAAVCALWRHRKTIERAELALAARRSAALLDPGLLAGAVQVSRTLGARKLVPLVAIAVLAIGVGMQLAGRDKPQVASAGENGRRPLPRAA
jgi:hypothetical protein